VLLNTSFNLAGEPIVNRVVEGYSTVPPLRHRRAGGGNGPASRSGCGAKPRLPEEIDA
jgi:hypothetical protein